MASQIPYQRCNKCGHKMFGIYENPEPARETCEACGGNETEYDCNNPHPENAAAKRKKREAKMRAPP